MGKQELVKKAIGPMEIVKALQSGSITIAQAQQMYNGVIPIGDNKGIAALYDIDKQVNQPLVIAEKEYSLDKLDARDIISAGPIPIGAVLASGIFTATLSVPANELWILEQIVLACPVTAVAGETVSVNVRSSEWQIPDIRTGTTVNIAGRSYYATDLVATSAAAIATTTVFSAVTELGKALRLPGGAVLTLVAWSSGNALTAAKTATLIPCGRKAKILVA